MKTKEQKSEFIPDYATSPGKTLQEDLREREEEHSGKEYVVDQNGL